MKKRIKKLLYFFIIAFISMGINFDAEAKLPKYMAQRAAELLIEKSELLKDAIIRINADYEVIKPIISAAVNEYIGEVSSADFFVKVLNGIKTPKAEVMNSSAKKLPNSDKVTQEQRVEQVQEIKDRFVEVLEHIQIVIPAEKTTEALSETMRKAVIKKLISDKAADVVKFLYSTEKRQHLTNWFKAARTSDSKYHDICVSNMPKDMREVLTKFDGIENNTTINGQFVNQHFPCWTGTLTCFMIPRSLAYTMLVSNNLVQRTKVALSQGTNPEKIIKLLFTLEIVDNWEDVKGICEKPDEQIPELLTPYDPYNCVPVPNTAYFVPNNKWPQGSCMISTIRNLLYILCRDAPNSKEVITNNMNDSVIEAFSGSIYTIPGTTSFTTIGAFANKILEGVTNEYKPDLALFAYTLYSLLKEKISITSLPTPKEYLNRVVPAELIKAILSKISKHDIKVEINNNPPKLTHTWPEKHLIISDSNIKKKITIAFGQCGSGSHIEIINIETLQND